MFLTHQKTDSLNELVTQPGCSGSLMAKSKEWGQKLAYAVGTMYMCTIIIVLCFVKFKPLMAAEQTGFFFHGLKKKFAKMKSTLVQKQARNNFKFFLCFGIFSTLFQDLCETF